MNIIEDTVKRQREYFSSGQTLPVAFRIAMLRKLREEIVRRSDDLESALHADLRRNRFETFLAEIILLVTELKHAVSHTRRWAAPRSVLPSIFNFCSFDSVIPEPYGLSLVISPWNYPVLLSLGPVAAAMSAGNCVILKPSELSPATSAVVSEIVQAALPKQYVTVVQGDADTASALLEQKFDKIFFTGSTKVGRLVLEAAARNLTPATLELGGKSPCIVSQSADLDVAAKRIVWGKLLNAGQTCVAPDYVLAQASVKDRLVARLIETIGTFYGPDIRSNPDYPRIVNQKNHSRLASYLQAEKVAFGGDHDQQDLYFSPTILTGVTWEDPVMREEIFGPILPILDYETLDEAIAQVNRHDKPLALYLFSRDKKEAEQVWSRCSFGGGCVNDTLSHLVNQRLPFGGVGNSGMGNYHGKWGFDAFSHYKSRVRRTVFPDFPLRYPPYGQKGMLKKILTALFVR